MWTLLAPLLVLVDPVWAGVPVELPPGEPLEPWAEVFAIADLTPGPPGSGPFIRIRPSGDQWLLEVRDRAGELRTTTVEVPATPAARENVVFLARSLLTPIEAQPLVIPVIIDPGELGAPEPEPEPQPVARPAPRPRPRPVQPAPTPEPEPDPDDADDADDAPIASEPLPMPPPPPPRPSPLRPPPQPAPADIPRPPRDSPLYLEADVGLGARPATGPGLEGGFGMGIGVGSWDVGLRADTRGRERFGALTGDRDLQDTAVGLKLARRAGPWRIGAIGSATHRRFRESGTVVARTWVPQLRAEGSYVLGRSALLEPLIGLTGDLLPIDLRVNGEVVQTLFPVRADLGVRITFRSASTSPR